MRTPLLLILALSLHATARGQSPDDIGFPTVSAAMEALKSRKDVVVKVENGWTIVQDEANEAYWSFTPVGHPAHPTAVKRTLHVKDGVLSIRMQSKCGAEKAACDKLVAEFVAMHEQMKQDMNAGTRKSPPPYQASAQQLERVTEAATRYFTAKDGKQYEQAYTQLAPSQKKIIPYAQFRDHSARFNTKAGDASARTIKKVSWYLNPPGVAPGLYGAVDFEGAFSNLAVHCGYTAWLEQADGSFLLIREEENSGDMATVAKMKPEERDKLRTQLRCRD
jgi:hypothetical protein